MPPVSRKSVKSRVRFTLVAAAVTVAGGVIFPATASATANPEPVRAQWVPDGGVDAVATVGNEIIVGGSFTGHIAALDAATGALKWLGDANGDVRALAITPDGSHVLAGGAFTTVGGATHRKLASLSVADGTVDPTWKARAGGTVRDIVVAGNRVFFAGAFTSHGGMIQQGLGAVFLSGGAPDTTFTTSANGNVYALATDSSRLFFGGKFTAVDGQLRNQLASVTLATGTAGYQLDSWAPAASCLKCNVDWDLALGSPPGLQQTVYAVGRNQGAVYAVDAVSGARVWQVKNANGDAQAVTLGADGLLYVGGHFTSIGGALKGELAQPRTILAAFNPVTGSLDSFSTRFLTTYPGIWALTSTPTSLVVAGDFTAAGQKVDGNNIDPYLAMFPFMSSS